MKLPSAFNAADHEKMGDFTPLPKGEYITVVKKSEVVLTKKAKKAKEAGDPNFQKKGQMAVLTHTVLAPKQYKGRTLFSRLNIINENEQAVEIANKELATICAAIGKVSVEDTDEIHGNPMLVTVDVTEDEKYNEIKYYDKVPEDVTPEMLEGMLASVGKDADAGSSASSGANQEAPKENKKRLWD